MLQKENNVQELPKKIMVCLPSLNCMVFKFGLVSRDVIFLLIVLKSMRRKKHLQHCCQCNSNVTSEYDQFF